MFRDQGLGRRSRAFGVNKVARSSKISLLSTASGMSSASTGSNSTVTQDSYSRSRDGRTRRKRRSDKREDESVLSKSAAKSTIKSPGVFDFLVDDNKAGDPTADVDPENYYRGHSSDSGISMGSNVAPSLPPLMEDTTENVYSSASSVASCDCFQDHNGWHDSGCYHGSPSSPAGFPPQPFVLPDPNQTHLPNPIILRDKTSSKTSPRLFRRFKRINARSLLQMQARIAELENELRAMDIRFTAINHKDKINPSQEEQMRRASIYLDLRLHLDQYYQALIATHQLQNITKMPTLPETQSFRKWIDSHVLNKPFLTDDSDLICFKPPDRPPPPLTYRAISLSALINLLIPLLLFKFVSGILNRLICWSIVIVAGTTIMQKLGLRFGKIDTTCIIAFGGISLGAALSLQAT